MPLPLSKIREKRQARAKLAEEARGILDKAEEEKRELTSEEEARFDEIHEKSGELRKEIEREERQHDLESGLEDRDNRQAAGTEQADPDDEERKEGRSRIFRSWLRDPSAITPEDRAEIRAGIQRMPEEVRALGTAAGTAGAFLVPEGFSGQMEEAMKAWGGMRESGATVLPTESGADLPWPTTDDTSNKGEIITESTEIGEQDTSYGQLIFKAYMYTSKIVLVPLQLLQDSAFDIEAHLSRVLGVRIGRITNQHFTTGTDADQPQGVITGATLGKTAAGAAAITHPELIDLEHSVDPAYRNMPGTRMMFHDDILKALKKLKDSQDRPLWLPGIALREPDTILGYRYIVNQDMPELATGNKTIAFGDFSKYLIRDVRGVTLVQFREKYMNKLQVGFMAFSRHDGGLLDAGTNPIKYLQQA